MNFSNNKPGTRRVLTEYDDTLKRIALRELGDASKWVDLITLNGLKPPYIVNTRAEMIQGTILAGDPILIPAPFSQTNIVTDADGIFLKDLDLTKGLLSAQAGDIIPITGLDNFKQALMIRVKTLKRELMFHPTYGCFVKLLLGKKVDAGNNALSAFFVMSAVKEDDRVDKVLSTVATGQVDSIKIDCAVQPIHDRLVNLNILLR